MSVCAHTPIWEFSLFCRREFIARAALCANMVADHFHYDITPYICLLNLSLSSLLIFSKPEPRSRFSLLPQSMSCWFITGNTYRKLTLLSRGGVGRIAGRCLCLFPSPGRAGPSQGSTATPPHPITGTEGVWAPPAPSLPTHPIPQPAGPASPLQGRGKTGLFPPSSGAVPRLISTATVGLFYAAVDTGFFLLLRKALAEVVCGKMLIGAK